MIGVMPISGSLQAAHDVLGLTLTSASKHSADLSFS